jgi:hypothetical protein
LLYWLLEEIDHRKRVGFSNPQLFLFMDDVAGLLDVIGAELDPLLQEIVLAGRHAGVHVVGASRSITFDQLPSLQALPGVMRAFPAQAAGDRRPEFVGRFVFQDRHNQSIVDIAWLTARDLDTAVELARSGWRACERR